MRCLSLISEPMSVHFDVRNFRLGLKPGLLIHPVRSALLLPEIASALLDTSMARRSVNCPTLWLATDLNARQMIDVVLLTFLPLQFSINNFPRALSRISVQRLVHHGLLWF